jgi:multidrug efflux pump
MRHAMGVAVFFGMIGVTAFGLFLTPVFYVLLRRLTGNRPLRLHGHVPSVDEAFGGTGSPSHGGGGGTVAIQPQPAAARGHDE